MSSALSGLSALSDSFVSFSSPETGAGVAFAGSFLSAGLALSSAFSSPFAGWVGESEPTGAEAVSPSEPFAGFLVLSAGAGVSFCSCTGVLACVFLSSSPPPNSF